MEEQMFESEEMLEDDLGEDFPQEMPHGEVKCQNCGKVIEDNVVEREFRGETYYFCSIICAETFIKKKKDN